MTLAPSIELRTVRARVRNRSLKLQPLVESVLADLWPGTTFDVSVRVDGRIKVDWVGGPTSTELVAAAGRALDEPNLSVSTLMIPGRRPTLLELTAMVHQAYKRRGVTKDETAPADLRVAVKDIARAVDLLPQPADVPVADREYFSVVLSFSGLRDADVEDWAGRRQPQDSYVKALAATFITFGASLETAAGRGATGAESVRG